jgi:hypothetical protein
MFMIVDITGSGYRGRVLFEIYSMVTRGSDSSSWRNLLPFPGLVQIGRRGFGWWEWIHGGPGEFQAVCREMVAHNVDDGNSVRVEGRAETCMILDGVPMDFYSRGSIGTLNGTGRVIAAAQPGFVGGIEWQAVGVYGRPAPARG